MDNELALALAKFQATHVLGIDESGTGAWAGSFYLGAVLGPLGWNLKGVRDSKKTNQKQRLKLVELIDDDVSILHAEVPATVADIEEHGHTGAYARAFRQVIERVCEYKTVPKKNIVVVMDGSRSVRLARILKSLGFLNNLFLVRADAKVPHVSAASIFAKFNRDYEMNLLDRKFPQYYFPQHAGYGTLLHRTKIKELGLIPNVHRPLTRNRK